MTLKLQQNNISKTLRVFNRSFYMFVLLSKATIIRLLLIHLFYIKKRSRLKTRDGFFVLFIWIFIRYFLYLIIDLQVISNEIQAV